MNVYSYAKQVRLVVAIELVMVLVAFVVATLFWTHLCDESLSSCLADGTFAKPATFLLLSAIRPFVFTPFLFVAFIGGKVFGPLVGTLLTATGSVFSCMAVFAVTKLVGRRLAKPWLRSNLPATFKFLRSQDYKLVFMARLVPILPFDVLSFLCGALDFRARSVIIATFLGTLPEAYLCAMLVDPTETLPAATLRSLVVIGTCLVLPLLAFEFASRRKGSGMWLSLKAMWRELVYEAQTNNDIVKRASFDANKPAVLLLYGFFSSRRAMTVLERMLTARGHQVLSFNLGGLLGTFFTRDILETANFVDYKIKRQIERHGLKKIHVVAHSKGGMVALWWVLKLGGHRYCDRIITMGTPYQGTRLTYLALITPLGLIWRDMGQMRPRSLFLKSLRDIEVPNHVHIFCLHSIRDRVARGLTGVFQPRQPSPNIFGVPMNHVSHFEFLYRRDVGEMISRILNEGAVPPLESVRAQTGSGSRLAGAPSGQEPGPLAESSGFE